MLQPYSSQSDVTKSLLRLMLANVSVVSIDSFCCAVDVTESVLWLFTLFCSCAPGRQCFSISCRCHKWQLFSQSFIDSLMLQALWVKAEAAELSQYWNPLGTEARHAVWSLVSKNTSKSYRVPKIHKQSKTITKILWIITVVVGAVNTFEEFGRAAQHAVWQRKIKSAFGKKRNVFLRFTKNDFWNKTLKTSIVAP